jgi:hypothetical protein
MFLRVLRAVRGHLGALASSLDPDLLSVADAARLIEVLAAIEKLAAGMRLLLARRIDNESLFGETGDRNAAAWLAKRTGQSARDAARDLETSKKLAALPDTAEAVRKGEVSPTQAGHVADGATADPAAEADLLDTARRGSMAELYRKTKATKAAAAGDDAARHAAAHRNRKYRSGINELGEGWGSHTGRADHLAKLNALLKPHTDAAFRKARREGRRERHEALEYDGLMSLLGIEPIVDAPGDTSDGQTGTPPTPVAAVRTPAQIIMKIDAAALKRGHTEAGEMCEIVGHGPIPVDALREFLPDAAIAVILQDGVDAFNVTNFSRRANATQQLVLHLLNIGCDRLGCPCTDHLQVDHRIDWAKVKVTELVNLDWLCTHDHDLKTRDGWELEPGTGKRQMFPPGQQWWRHAAHPPDAEPPGSERSAA